MILEVNEENVVIDNIRFTRNGLRKIVTGSRKSSLILGIWYHFNITLEDRAFWQENLKVKKAGLDKG